MKAYTKIAIFLTLLVFLTVCRKKDKNDLNTCANVNGFDVVQYGNEFEILINLASGHAFEISFLESGNGISPENGKKIIVYTTDSFLNIETIGLKGGKNYSIYIRNLCSNDRKSDWGFEKNMYVESYSYPPYQLQASNGGITWLDSNSRPSAIKYQIQCDVKGTDISKRLTYSSRDKFFYKTKMNPNIEYAFYVRSYTDSIKGWSNWAGPIMYLNHNYQYFCLAPSELHYNDDQSFADSTLNGVIDWEKNGESVFQYAITLPNEPLQFNNSGFVFNDNTFHVAFTSYIKFDFYVRSVCQNSDTSAWLGPIYVDKSK